MKIGIAGDKIVGGKPLITTLLKQSEEDACEVKIKKRFCLSWPRKIEILRWPDIKQIKECDIVHAVFPFHTVESVIIAKLLGKKVIYHWIGTDVWYLLDSLADDFKKGQYSHFLYKIFFKILKHFADFHLCGSGNLKKGLAIRGIKAEIIPIVPLKMSFRLGSGKLSLTVLSYLPEERHEFYGSKIFFDLAKEFPEVTFLALCKEGEMSKSSNSNIQYLPYQENMAKIYQKTGIILRMPEHDGMSLMVLDGLLRGKQIIFSYKFPFCYQANNFSEAKKALRLFIKNPKTNREGAEFVKKNFSHERISRRLVRIYREVLEK